MFTLIIAHTNYSTPIVTRTNQNRNSFTLIMMSTKCNRRHHTTHNLYNAHQLQHTPTSTRTITPSHHNLLSGIEAEEAQANDEQSAAELRGRGQTGVWGQWGVFLYIDW